MKKLSIKCDNTTLTANGYGVGIAGKRIEELIKGALPKGIEPFKDYPVKVNLYIEFLGSDELKIKTEGYELPEEKIEEAEEDE